jgi:translation elongation factor EF-1alpha
MNKAKAHMSITIIGHVSSGKTTVAERLDYMSGGIDRQTIHNIEKEATDVRRLLVLTF